MLRRYQWTKLNKQQVGSYAEYFVKMELTMYGFQVYSTEVDDRGIDFVARHENGPYLAIQVKSVRKPGYVFMKKSKFKLAGDLYLALGLLEDDQPPTFIWSPRMSGKRLDLSFAAAIMAERGRPASLSGG